ncbi:hypothetical protein C8Q76DRAFT_701395 [Earliella scabrosa]|nr:hypothetical protein C8Q76DRAFT_701395 [Earliella scabrosa]
MVILLSGLGVSSAVSSPLVSLTLSALVCRPPSPCHRKPSRSLGLEIPHGVCCPYLVGGEEWMSSDGELVPLGSCHRERCGCVGGMPGYLQCVWRVCGGARVRARACIVYMYYYI